jgi:hypothetical protein
MALRNSCLFFELAAQLGAVSPWSGFQRSSVRLVPVNLLFASVLVN